MTKNFMLVGALIAGIFGLFQGAYATLPASSHTPEPTNAVAQVRNTDSPTNTAAFVMPTFIPTPTNTPTLNPTESIAMMTAVTGVTANADWTPIERDFGGVMMVLVPSGCFEMGMPDDTIQALKKQSPRNEAYFESMGPMHHQCFETLFWLDKTEVTQAQFADNDGVKANLNQFTGDNRPVENITWFEARDYCEKRGGRLPTEAEWEYAARGPDGLIYPWGDEIVSINAVYNDNSNHQTAEVGSKPGGLSWVGALDMSGNVWEWVNTIYGIDANDNHDFSEFGDHLFTYPYNAADGREANNDDRTNMRVLRSGSWKYPDIFLGATNRITSPPDYISDTFGFRCARSQ